MAGKRSSPRRPRRRKKKRKPLPDLTLGRSRFPSGKLVISEHAVERQIDREISLEQVKEVVFAPDIIRKERRGRKKAQKRLGDRIVSVVYRWNESTGKIYVITVI